MGHHGDRHFFLGGCRTCTAGSFQCAGEFGACWGWVGIVLAVTLKEGI